MLCLLVSLGASEADVDLLSQPSLRGADTCHYRGTRLKSPPTPSLRLDPVNSVSNWCLAPIILSSRFERPVNQWVFV